MSDGMWRMYSRLISFYAYDHQHQCANELAHLEMVSTIVHQLTRNLSMEEIEESGFANYYVDHTVGVWPMAAGGIPFNSCEFQSKGDAITDLFENMAAEQKARSTARSITTRSMRCPLTT